MGKKSQGQTTAAPQAGAAARQAVKQRASAASASTEASSVAKRGHHNGHHGGGGLGVSTSAAKTVPVEAPVTPVSPKTAQRKSMERKLQEDANTKIRSRLANPSTAGQITQGPVNALVINGLANAVEKGTKSEAELALKCLEVFAQDNGGAGLAFVLCCEKCTEILFDAVGHKDKAVSEAAQNALGTVSDRILGAFVRQFLTGFLKALGGKSKPVQKETALSLVSNLTQRFPMFVRQELDSMIPLVSDLMNDIKPSVKKLAITVMMELLEVCGNKDLVPFFPVVIEANENLKRIPECIEKLAGCIFVQNVDAPALSVLIPVLIRGLNSKSDVTIRRTCVIIDNMSKLVDDPREGYPLVPKIYPLVDTRIEHVADPDARAIVEKCRDTMGILVASNGRANLNADKVISKNIAGSKEIAYEIMELLDSSCTALVYATHYDPNLWSQVFVPYVGNDKSGISKVLHELQVMAKPPQEAEFNEEQGETLYSGSFSLAYGTLTLLRDTKLHLKKHKFYGLLGGNNCGKTTLMRALANEQVEGFPKRDELRTVFVEHEIEERVVDAKKLFGNMTSGKRLSRSSSELGFEAGFVPPNPSTPDGKLLNIDLAGVDWVVDTCNNLYVCNPPIKRKDAIAELLNIGFGDKVHGKNPKAAADLNNPLTTYSGGWKVKMQLAAGKLMNADILMLDEPTGHLDVNNIKWMKDWLRAFPGTIVATSHDGKFLDEMTTGIIWFQDRKLKQFVSSKHGQVLAEFVKKYPEKKAYFELKSKNLVFSFPPPGPLDGVKSKGRAILKMTNVFFKYPTHKEWTVQDITLSMCMLSRVAVVGANGSGKSTAIKLLLGELKPEKGTIFRHSGSRIAYVAQHAFHHLEKHMTKSPAQYLLWRFAGNDDRESLENQTKDVNVDEEALRAVPWCIDVTSLQVRKCEFGSKADKPVEPESLLNRRKNKEKKYEYETKWKNKPIDMTTWVVRDTLIAMGYEKLVCREDEKQAAAAGLMLRPLTQPAVEAHLKQFGLDSEAASHSPIQSLSGGQKVKVVLGGAMWLNPHIIVLDEPTNYLDRDGLGALTAGLSNYGGGVVIISHNKEFCDSIATEQWIMDGGKLRREGEVVGDDTPLAEMEAAEDIVDGMGNKIEVKKHKNLTAKEIKKQIKELEKKLKADKKKNELTDAFKWEMQDRLTELNTQLEGLTH